MTQCLKCLGTIQLGEIRTCRSAQDVLDGGDHYGFQKVKDRISCGIFGS
ncbi:MAG: hypothetical protein ACLUR5_00450 [Eubacterium ventriosum]